ncbi:MAG TPA: hypothetical protein ENI62_08130 [Gammaproteobacteria bacterium]|nr:hypothetical protein [Gammaproteobacteria bacterium]
MSEQENIEALAQQCQSAEEYAMLATKIAATDAEHARTLLKEAELQSQFPADYIRTAKGYIALADSAYASDLIEQAEEACFEAMEYAAVGQAWGELLGNSDKAAVLLQQAASEVQSMPERLLLAQMAAASGADELAQSLYTQIEKSCESIEDYAALASTLLDSENPSAAQKLFASAGKLCDDIASTVLYAKTAANLFHDPKQQRSILEEVEADCQFPKEFVQLATAYYQLLGDTAKVDELLEQGTEFAFSGAEYLDLANGYLQLKEDKSAAGDAYKKALPEITDRKQLQEMAKTASHDLEDRDLAKAIYRKLEQRSQNTTERLALAQSILDDIDDKDYAVDLYQRIEEELTTPRDLTDLAVSLMKNLGDRDRAIGVVHKALDHSDSFQVLRSLFDNAVKIVNDEKTSQLILDKWRNAAESTAELLIIYQSQGEVHEVQKGEAQNGVAKNDSKQGRSILLAAEERVASLGEMKNVVKVVAEDFPEDTAWQQRLVDKLQRRQANQSTYTTFQDQERKATQGLQLIRLARAVMQQLGDEYYSRKLLNAAHATLLEQPVDLYVYEQLLSSIAHDLNDREWALDVLQGLPQRCVSLSQINQLTDMALQILGDRELAHQLLCDYAEKSVSTKQRSIQELLQLASIVWQKLQNPVWLEQLLRTASDKATTLFDWVTIGELAHQAGLQEFATKAYDQAAIGCQNANQFRQFYTILRSSSLSPATTRHYYALGAQALSSPKERLRWIEGIIDIVADSKWAHDEYQKLAPELATGPAAKLFYNSRRYRLQGRS